MSTGGQNFRRIKGLAGCGQDLVQEAELLVFTGQQFALQADFLRHEKNVVIERLLFRLAQDLGNFFRIDGAGQNGQELPGGKMFQDMGAVFVGHQDRAASFGIRRCGLWCSHPGGPRPRPE